MLSTNPTERPKNAQACLEEFPTFFRERQAVALHLSSLVMGLYEYLDGHGAPPERRPKLEKLDEALTEHLAGDAEQWTRQVAAPPTGSWKRNPRKIFDRFAAKGLPAFALVKWARNIYGHLGVVVSDGLFRNLQSFDDYLLDKFPWLYHVVSEFQQRELPNLGVVSVPALDDAVARASAALHADRKVRLDALLQSQRELRRLAREWQKTRFNPANLLTQLSEEPKAIVATASPLWSRLEEATISRDGAGLRRALAIAEQRGLTAPSTAYAAAGNGASAALPAEADQDGREMRRARDAIREAKKLLDELKRSPHSPNWKGLRRMLFGKLHHVDIYDIHDMMEETCPYAFPANTRDCIDWMEDHAGLLQALEAQTLKDEVGPLVLQARVDSCAKSREISDLVDAVESAATDGVEWWCPAMQQAFTLLDKLLVAAGEVGPPMGRDSQRLHACLTKYPSLSDRLSEFLANDPAKSVAAAGLDVGGIRHQQAEDLKDRGRLMQHMMTVASRWQYDPRKLLAWCLMADIDAIRNRLREFDSGSMSWVKSNGGHLLTQIFVQRLLQRI